MTGWNQGRRAVSPSVSAVIAARNRPERLRSLLLSLRNQEVQPTEVIVVDDGSQPPIPVFDGVDTHIRLDAPAGACRARNVGLRRSSGQYVLLVDDDAELIDPSLIRRALELAERVERLGAIAFRQLDAEGRPHWMQPLPGEELRLAPTFYGYGALLTRKALQAAGDFFEPLQYYYEENELSMRFIDHEFRVLYDPSLAIVHHTEPTGRDYRLIHRLGWRNTMFTVIARFPAWMIPGGLMVASVRWVRLARGWKVLHLSDLWWGWSALATKLPELLRRRAPIRLATLRWMRSLRNQVILPELRTPSEGAVATSVSVK